MADGIDASTHDVEATSADTVIDGRRSDPQRDELRARHDAVLAARELGDLKVLGGYAAHIAV